MSLFLSSILLLTGISSYFEFRAAAMTLRTVLLSLQALLAAAEPDDPQDAVVANQVRQLLLKAVLFLICDSLVVYSVNR